jgi:hypothetical protein
MGSKAVSFILIAILSISTLTYGNVFADEPIKITDHKKYIDDAGLVHIIGIIENTGIMPIGFVRVTANLADEQGKPLPSYDTVALFRTVLPGYVTPFDIPISDRNVGDRIASYTLSMNWNIVDTKPEKFEFSGINAFTLTHVDPRTLQSRSPHELGHSHQTDELHAHSETSGYVTNSGELTTKSIKAAAIWYDKEGKFSGFDWQVVSKKLAPGENARFVFMTHPKPMGYYLLIVESDNYIAMLKENGEKMIPIHEAPKSNMNFPSIDAISISRVTLVNESNQPISNVEAGQMVLLQSVMKNNLDTKQKFITIYQIKDSSGTPVMLFWMSSNIPARESIDTAISWIPEIKGTYTLQIFLWESLANPIPLGEFSESTITVSA